MPTRNQETVDIRTKLDDLSASLKKLANSLLRSESSHFIEPQIINRLLAMATRIGQLKSLEENEGEIFASLLKSITDIIQGAGDLSRGPRLQSFEERAKIIRLLKNLEEEMLNFIPTIITMDEERKERKYETFGGLLQKLIDAIQEKRHMLIREDSKSINRVLS